MAIDLIFSQPVAPNPTAASRSDRLGPSGSNRSAGIRTLPEGDGDNFLSTLQHAARDQSPARKPEPPVGSRLTRPGADGVDGKIDDASDQENSATDIPAPTESEQQAEPMTIEWNLTAFIKLLESLGSFHAADNLSDLPAMADADLADNDLITAIESLLARLQQRPIGMTADLKAGLEQLQQFMAMARGTADGGSGQGLSPSQISELTQINQWLNELTGSLQTQKATSDLLMAEGPGDASNSPPIAADSEGSAGTTLKAPEINGGSPGPVSLQSTEQSAVRSQSENRSAGDPKLATDSQPLAAKNGHDAKAARAVEKPAAEASKAQDPMAAGRVAPRADLSAVPGRIAEVSDRNQAGMREAAPVKPNTSPGPDPAVARGSENQTQSAAGSEPLSKLLQEAQPVKEGARTAASSAFEETAGKVIKIEAGANDNGLLNSSDPNLPKTAEPAVAQKEIEAGQSGLRNQTLDQIVRKSAIHFRNGQHEARIDLKPEFLGHVRMQVISADHQVTVKILAEHGFVKDMIESHIHQLKADLQQQGLAVDKLEVAVSRDADDSGNDKSKFAQSKAKPGNAGQQSEEHPAENKKRETGQRVRTAAGIATVDYFA